MEYLSHAEKGASARTPLEALLLVDMKEQEVYEIDPQTVKQQGEDVEWSLAGKPDQPLETPDWKTKDLRSMQMVKFRLGKDGHFLEMQLPLLVNGKPAY